MRCVHCQQSDVFQTESGMWYHANGSRRSESSFGWTASAFCSRAYRASRGEVPDLPRVEIEFEQLQIV